MDRCGSRARIRGLESERPLPALNRRSPQNSVSKIPRRPKLSTPPNRTHLATIKISLNQHDPTRQFKQNFLVARFLFRFLRVTSRRIRSDDRCERVNHIELEGKLSDLQSYYNRPRTRSSLGGNTPAEDASGTPRSPIKLNKIRWQTHCRELYHLPIAA